MIHVFIIDVLRVNSIGKIIIISISKIKKITAIKKKWIENGSRFNAIALKPHSNGVDFCHSIIDFFLIIIITIIIIIIKIRIVIKYFIERLIIYF